jgi:hypothetical protein
MVVAAVLGTKKTKYSLDSADFEWALAVREQQMDSIFLN